MMAIKLKPQKIKRNVLVLRHYCIRPNTLTLINFIAILKRGITEFLNINIKIFLFPFANVAKKKK